MSLVSWTSCALGSAVLAGSLLVAASAPALGAPPATTTALSGGTFHLDVPSVVRESNIVLGIPNGQAVQSVPLGNGSAGAAVWAASGLTAQLNRNDTFPDRKSPGQIAIPGLAAMTAAADYQGVLDLYTGVYTQSGGGITARTYLRADKDELVIDVTGANPNVGQTVSGYLWGSRSPVASANQTVASLAETWTDNATGGTGSVFGSLLGVTAVGRNVHASVVDNKTVSVGFTPNTDGSFRVLVAVPTWTGGNGTTAAANFLGNDVTASSAQLSSAHTTWWAAYWKRVHLLQMRSADGTAQYMENLRTLFLYQQASLQRGALPGSQAGTASLFSFAQDSHQWVPADYWFWNLRTQVSGNLSAGDPQLNQSIFSLYTNNLANLSAWTSQHVPGTSGVCVPETMRFNGNGYYAGGWAASNASCDTTIAPSYNSQTITSGAEIVQWIWQQYLQTNDTALLQRSYPLMKAVVQFLLSYAPVGSDGQRHMVANEHENQWSVQDPSMALTAMAAVFPIVGRAATVLNQDPALVTQLATAGSQIPPLTRTDSATHTQVVRDTTHDADTGYVLAMSAQPAAPAHNNENTELEPIWPFGTISDTSPLRNIALRTYQARVNRIATDWDTDAVVAARLGQANDVAAILSADVQKYQVYPNGMSSLFGGEGTEFYNEQTAVVATAVDQALVQDYDGTLRIAPSWPSTWTVSGSVATLNRATVNVQVSGGFPTTVVLAAAAQGTQRLRSPWAGQNVEVRDATSGAVVVSGTTSGTLDVPMTAGRQYVVQRVSQPTSAQTYAPVTGTAVVTARHLGPVQIGLDAPGPLASLSNNVAISHDTATNTGNFDGNGSSFSYEALAAAGVTPGSVVQAGGLAFTWPGSATGGVVDNVVSHGQRVVPANRTGSRLGFLVSASWGPAGGTGQVVYTDGSSDTFSLTGADWLQDNGSVAVRTAYGNRPGNSRYNQPAYVDVVTIPLAAGKTVRYVQLPDVSSAPANGTATLHVFAVTVA